MSDGNKERFFPEFDYPTYEDWKEACITALKGADFERKMFKKTYEGITLEGIYSKEDWNKTPHVANQFPGYYPFSRGNKYSGRKLNAWQIVQEIPYILPEDFNKAALVDLERGVDAIYMKLNPELLLSGDVNSNESLSNGVFITNINDLDVAFNGIDLTETAVMLDAGAATYAASSLIAAFLNKNNIPLDKAKIFFGYDPIGTFAQTGTVSTDFTVFFDEAQELAEWVSKNMPFSKAFKMNGDAFHNGGGNAVQEIAYAFATGVDYIRRIGKRGMSIQDLAKQFYLSLSSGNYYFIELAKIRAARLVWAKIIREFGGNEDDSKIFIHVNTSGRERSKFDPYVNMLRNTSQAFSAVVGGADSIKAGFFDEAWGLPSEFSRRMSRNTQHILKEEAHLLDTIDPAGGSWYIERITYQLAEKIWEEFRKVEQQGGALEALKNNFIQERLEENFKLRLKNLSTRKDVILGTNKYPNLDEKPVENSLSYDEKSIISFKEKAGKFIESRDSETVNASLSKMESPNNRRFNDAIAASSNGATAYEINKAITGEIAEFTINSIKLNRGSAIFEELRDAANAYKEREGNYPLLDFLCFAPLKVYKPRADFSADFFAVGGFKAVIRDGFKTSADAIKSIKELSPKAIVICSSDKVYEETVPEFAKALKEIHPETKVILAGYPKDKVEEYKEAGVDDFIHVKANIYEHNVDLQKIYGMRK